LFKGALRRRLQTFLGGLIICMSIIFLLLFNTDTKL
jgi:uncharacterized membrane protein SpoIIM required for sporulation